MPAQESLTVRRQEINTAGIPPAGTYTASETDSLKTKHDFREEEQTWTGSDSKWMRDLK